MRYLVVHNLNRDGRIIPPGEFVRLDDATAKILLDKKHIVAENDLGENPPPDVVRKVVGAGLLFAPGTVKSAERRLSMYDPIGVVLLRIDNLVRRYGSLQNLLGAITINDLEAWSK